MGHGGLQLMLFLRIKILNDVNELQGLKMGGKPDSDPVKIGGAHFRYTVHKPDQNTRWENG
jgi:hypothetical protein